MSLIERAISSLPSGDRRLPAPLPPDGSAHDAWHDADTVMDVGAAGDAEADTAGPASAHWQLVPPTRALAAGGPLVHLDLARLRKLGYATPDVAHTRLGQSVRGIKRQLLANATGRGAPLVERGRLIMVTSARPGEGKSFVALNLALSIAAERDHSVLLVDADVTNPSILATLEIDSGPGLTDALRDEPDMIASRVLRTNLRRLSLLPIGTRTDRAAELLGSHAMERALAVLCRNDPRCVVVFDAPPMLGTAEAQALAGLMGQAVVVVEAGVTPRATVDEALDLLEPVPMVGVVLNKAADRNA